MSNLNLVLFHGDELFLINHERKPFTPVKPICGLLGVDWKGQYVKLKNDETWGCGDISIPSNGGPQSMLCIPLQNLPAWLAGISVNKVKPEIREKLRTYQRECFRVLWDYWTEGEAVNPRKQSELSSAKLRAELDKARQDGYQQGERAVLRLIARHGDQWRKVFQLFLVLRRAGMTPAMVEMPLGIQRADVVELEAFALHSGIKLPTSGLELGSMQSEGREFLALLESAVRS